MEHSVAVVPHIAMVLPFCFLLLAIALCPLFSPHWWEKDKNKGKVVALLAGPMAVYYLFTSPSALGHTVDEYISFIVFLWALYTVAGGIVFRGDLRATPQTNLLFLGVGAVLANLIGTTGASMVLIYALLRTNSERRHTVHTFVFFIFVVSNCGGCLLPIGDPPLFLGYLRGVPFLWTFWALLWRWVFVNGILLGVYCVWDSVAYTRETLKDMAIDIKTREPFSIEGRRNLALLLAIIASVICVPTGWREAAMIAIGFLSSYWTPQAYREANRFSWGAIREVAILFAGIFVTMLPALQILELRGGSLGIKEPWQFFWAAGALSSFLDNAPTYLCFSSLASGLLGLDPAHLDQLASHPQGQAILKAISTGAVFMGANTYIGNAPNFMVKAISEGQGIKMPSFFAYMLYSCAILIPIFVFYTFLFF